MGPIRAAPLLRAVGLCLLAALSSCAQVGFVSSPLTKFLDAEEGAKPYVLGLSTRLDEQPPSTPHRTMLLRNGNGTLYRCFLPALAAPEQGGGGAASSSGDASLAMSEQASLLAAKKQPTELLDALGEHCYYFYDEWWTYELCYKKHVRQYHKTSEGQVEAEYLLGVYDELEQGEDEDAVQVDSTDVSGGMRFVSQLYVGGEACELNGEQRQAEVRFTCGTDGAGTRLASIKEPSSCSYVLTVATPRLCKHPAFQEQPASASLIRCHPLEEEEEEEGAGVGQCSGGGGGGGAALGDAAAAAAPGQLGAAGGGGAAEAAEPAADDGGSIETYEDDEGLLTDLVEGGFQVEDEEEEEEGYTDDDPYA